MRRSALLCCAVAVSGLLAGCTGTGVFLDHTFSYFGENPNAPAGESEMFQTLRGEHVEVTPLVPEAGDVWPGPQKPDPTMQELEQQQNTNVPPLNSDADRRQPHRASQLPSAVKPGGPPALIAPPEQTPGGPAVDVTGGEKVPGYRQLQPPSSKKGILVPNGNGTSTLIGPDGSISTVPDKP